jgi:hypothetical protein
MPKIILHIGRHKTGSTSLQKFCDRNREQLKSNGIYYPDLDGSNFGHHQLPIAVAKSKGCTYDELISLNEVKSIRAELSVVKESIILISSEAFQNISPESVRDVFHDYDVEVVVYLRDQCSYLSSAYAQRVQASNEVISLEAYYNSFFSGLADYQKFLNDWESVFPGKIKVSVFDKSQMIGEDVVVDFFERHLAINNFTLQQDFLFEQEDANPSISVNTLMCKRRLNDFLPMDFPEKQDLYNYLAEISSIDESAAVGFSKEYQSSLINTYKETNRNIAERYLNNGQEILFKDIASKYRASDYKVSVSQYHAFLGAVLDRFPDIGEYRENNAMEKASKEPQESSFWQDECARRHNTWQNECARIHDKYARGHDAWQSRCDNLERKIDHYEGLLSVAAEQVSVIDEKKTNGLILKALDVWRRFGMKLKSDEYRSILDAVLSSKC